MYAKSNNKRGIRNKSRIMLPIKLRKKLIPKIGIIMSAINENVKIVLLTLRKEFILNIRSISSFIYYRHTSNNNTPALSKI